MTADFTMQRVKMVDGQLRTTDVNHVPLLEAMVEVPREEFVPARRRAFAYIDEDLEVAPAISSRGARFLMEPSPFGRLVQLAQITPGDFVLDVGCATGYSSAVLSRLAGSVLALESDPDLVRQASDKLSSLGYDNVAVIEGRLAEGCPDQAPYDVIFIGASVDQVPDALLSQLRDGGRLVTVIGRGNAGQATLFLREGDVFSSRRSFNAGVAPLAEFAREPSFEF